MRNLQPLPEATDDAGREQNRLTGMYRQVLRKDPLEGARYVFTPDTGPAVEHRYIDGKWQPVTLTVRSRSRSQGRSSRS